MTKAVNNSREPGGSSELKGFEVSISLLKWKERMQLVKKLLIHVVRYHRNPTIVISFFILVRQTVLKATSMSLAKMVGRLTGCCLWSPAGVESQVRAEVRILSRAS